MLFRLMRGSGVAGLSGMAPMSERDGLAIARPLLSVAKSTLVAFAHARGAAFVEDPSNADPHYARPRLRSLIAGLAAEGLDFEGLARLARRAAEADEALERMTAAGRSRGSARMERSTPASCSRRRSRSSSASSSAGSLRPRARPEPDRAREDRGACAPPAGGFHARTGARRQCRRRGRAPIGQGAVELRAGAGEAEEAIGSRCGRRKL